MAATPEHVLWAIEQPCALRNAKDWADPEQAERELRPLRAFYEAETHGRVFEGICMDQSTAELPEPAVAMGFPLAEIFDAFGDRDFLQNTCGNCPANLDDGDNCCLAGCHGWFDTQNVRPPINRIMEEIKTQGRDVQYTCFDLHHFHQGFYALWTRPVWTGKTLLQAIDLFHRVAADHVGSHVAAVRFSRALQAAERTDSAVRVKLVPPGSLAGNRWTIAQHCPKCLAKWEENARRCRACDHQGGAAPARSRNARGKRPFVPLSRVIGQQNVGEFLKRYAQRSIES